METILISQKLRKKEKCLLWCLNKHKMWKRLRYFNPNFTLNCLLPLKCFCLIQWSKSTDRRSIWTFFLHVKVQHKNDLTNWNGNCFNGFFTRNVFWPYEKLQQIHDECVTRIVIWDNLLCQFFIENRQYHFHTKLIPMFVSKWPTFLMSRLGTVQCEYIICQ